MKPILSLSRLLVGSIFILSGLIKANDPVGFAHKLDEYFSPAVFDLEVFMPFSLTIAVFICVVEIVLGLTCIFGVFRKLTAWSLLGFIVFFSFLTFYSAYYNKVTDCGCFGDALKFTPWQSFIKDMVLLLFILPLFFLQKHSSYSNLRLTKQLAFLSITLITGLTFLIFDWWFPALFALVLIGIGYLLINKSKDLLPAGLLALGLLFSGFFCYYTIQNLPARDYRPYKIGQNITEGMDYPENAKPTITHMFIENLTTGEIKGVQMSEIPWEDKNWKYRSDLEAEIIQEGDLPAIHDFSISDIDGVDQTETILQWDKVLVIVSYNIDKTSPSEWSKLKSIVDSATKKHYAIIGLTASSIEQAEALSAKGGFKASFYNTDETALKTIIRSNPGIMLLEKGTIRAKWHVNNLPEHGF
ncbi:MAG: DoxX family protein [Flavobacteriales bacterium]